MRCAWFDSVALQNMLLLAENFTLKVLTRLAHKVLGISKLKYIWQFLTIGMSLVLNIFIKKRLMTKSNDAWKQKTSSIDAYWYYWRRSLVNAIFSVSAFVVFGLTNDDDGDIQTTNETGTQEAQPSITHFLALRPRP